MPELLIIDDDEELCSELAETFRLEGYAVTATSDSVEGSMLIKKHKYDVALFDYKMKGFNGLDLIRLLKGLNPACAAFLISGRAGIETLARDERVTGLLAGIVTKPFDVDDLLAKVKAALPPKIRG